MKQLIELTQDKFQEIYTSEKFRNEVAYAHKCCKSGGEFMYFKTCSYPVEYIVSEEQKKIANEERVRAKAARVASVGNKLVFVGMGCNYEAKYEDDVCNHRIRTEFVNSKGRRFFVEFGTGRGEQMRVDFSVDRDLENAYEAKRAELYEERSKVKKYSKEWHDITKEIDKYLEQPFYNYAGLQRDGSNWPKYTLQNVLQLVNETFDCKFQEIEVDYYNLTTDDFICVSPN